MAVFVGIILGVYLFILSSKKSTDFMNPAVLFSVVILTSYFLACLHFSGLQSDYPIWFTILIFLLIFAFYVGCQTGKGIKIVEPEIIDAESYSASTMRLVVFLLWFFIVLSFVITIRQLGAPPAISGTNRADYFVSGWGSIVLLQTTLMGLLLFDRYNEKATGNWFWIYLISIIIIALLFANKYQLLYMLVLALVARNSYGKKIRLGTLIITALIAIVLFLILFIFVYENMYGVSMAVIYNRYRMQLPSKFQVLTQPYLYTAFNYENLYNYLVNSVHHLHGYKSFNAVIDIFHLESLFSHYYDFYMDEWYWMLKVPSLTTGTMFEDFAQDGGVPWMIIGTYLCGIWSSFSFRKFKSNMNFLWFFMYAAAIVSICFAFFSNAFTSKVTTINIIAAWIVGVLIKYTITFKGKVI